MTAGGLAGAAPAGFVRDPAIPVHLVTVAYGSDDALPAFFASLQAQTGIDWRLTVIENASPAGRSALLDRLDDPRIALLRNTANLGFARAVNQGLRRAVGQGADFVMLINNDICFAPDFLAALLRQRDALAAPVIAPRVMDMHDVARSWYAGGHFQRDWVITNIHESFDPQDTRAARAVEFASGCCLGIMTAVLREVGLLDESFFVYWEDSDFCLRLQARGIPILYVRDPFLRHIGGASSGGEGTASYQRLYFAAYAVFLAKHFGRQGAIKGFLRLTMKHFGRENADWRMATRAMFAMLRGLARRLRPEPRL